MGVYISHYCINSFVWFVIVDCFVAPLTIMFTTPGIALAGLAAMVPGALAAPTAPGCDGPDSRVYPPVGAVVIDASGAYTGSYNTISAGVATLKNQTAEQTVFILPGTYHEQVLVSPLQGPLVFQGYTCDSSSYAANQVTITSGLAQKDIPPEVTGEARNDLTSTLRLKSDNIRVYNLNVANTAGNVGQALAVNVNATNNGFYGVNFTGEKLHVSLQYQEYTDAPDQATRTQSSATRVASSTPTATSTAPSISSLAATLSPGSRAATSSRSGPGSSRPADANPTTALPTTSSTRPRSLGQLARAPHIWVAPGARTPASSSKTAI